MDHKGRTEGQGDIIGVPQMPRRCAALCNERILDDRKNAEQNESRREKRRVAAHLLLREPSADAEGPLNVDGFDQERRQNAAVNKLKNAPVPKV